MIYDYFSMRLRGSDEWDLTIGSGVLRFFVVGNVTNPAPNVKVQDIDVVGASGKVDFTEMPRVTFDNKTVEVVLQGESDNIMPEVETGLSSYQGRVVEFSFDANDETHSPNWMMVGRLTIKFDLFKNRIFLSLYCEPFKYGTEVKEKTMSVLPSYERDVNTASWSEGLISGGGGELTPALETNGTFIYFDSEPGAVFQRIKPVSGNDGKYLAFGIVSIIGGDVWFEWSENGKIVKSRSIAKVENGQIMMYVSIDGSCYDWRTVNGSRVYVPTVRCSYIMSGYLPTASYGISRDVSMDLPSNVEIRPEVNTTYQNVYIISDGVVAEDKVSSEYRSIPRFVLPNINASFGGEITKSVFAAIPKTAGTSPVVRFRYREAEVF